MPSINAASTVRIHTQHEHALKSHAGHKAERPHTSPRPASETATEMRETPDKSRARGVLRLLEEGHFKGVAAVRLRMNFHAELAQKGDAAQTGAARNAAIALQSGMTGILDGAKDQLGEQAAAVFSRFEQTVANSLGNEATASDIRATAAAAIETLKSDLASLFEPGDVSATQDASTPVGTGDAPAGVTREMEQPGDATGAAASASSLLQRLLDDIDLLAATFAETAGSATQLAGIEDIIAPSGNGVAFEKFVEQYQAQFGSGVDQSDELPLIDDHA